MFFIELRIDSPELVFHVTIATAPSPSRETTRCLTLAGIGVWLFALLGSGLALWHYSTAPGSSGVPVKRLPASEDSVATFGRRQLKVFLHPHCGCSRATVSSLNAVVQSGDFDVDIEVHFFVPDDVAADWHLTSLWRQAQWLPDAVCRIDECGRDSKLFGVETSGHVLLFDSTGQRVFSGGITSGRGHEGDNPGAHALTMLLQGESVDTNTFPVYGCAIRTPKTPTPGRLSK